MLFLLTFLLFCLADMSRQLCLEQRSVIKFMSAQGATPIACWRNLREVYGDSALGKTRVRAWHKHFREGDIHSGTADKAWPGRPRSGRCRLHIEKIDQQLQQDRRQSVRELAVTTGVPRATVQRILRRDLNLRHVAAKFIPRILTDEQKAFRVRLCQLNLEQFEHEGLLFLQRIVTGHESSFHTFDPDTKIKDTQWIAKDARWPRKALRSRTRQSTMLTAFFDCNGLIHAEWKGHGDSITSEEYCLLLGRLRESIRRKRPELWVMNGDWRTFLLHHDNATPHTATITLAHLGENKMDMVPHPPYSPDLAPSDYFLFPEIKAKMRGVAYRNIAQVQAAATEVMRQIPVEKFEEAIKDLPVRWAKCVQVQGDYFEGDGLVVPDFMVEISDSEQDAENSSSDSD